MEIALADAAPFQTLRYTLNGAVATITLARPATLNALTAAMHAELRAALTMAEADPAVRTLVLTGEGRAFSSGQDLTEDMPRGADGRLDLGPPLERDYNPLIKRLAAFPKVTIAALNGPAVGASANIALACDIVVAARSATIHEAFAKIALVPDAGGTYILPRIVGPKAALAMMLIAEPVTAERCQQLGLVWQVFDDEEFHGGVAKLAARLGAGPLAAQQAIKQALAASHGNDLAAQLDLERDLQRQCGAHPDFLEGIAAFRDKRAPKFR